MSDLDAVKETTRKAVKAVKTEVAQFDATQTQFAETFREMAEKGVEQAKDGYARFRNAAEEATDLVEDTYLTATRGATEFNLKAIDALRTNVNSGFDYARELFAVKSISEAIELSATHMRRQFETLSAQAREFSALAQKVATETSEPIKENVGKSFKVN